MSNILPPFTLDDCDDSGNRLTVTVGDDTVVVYHTEDPEDITRGILTLINPHQARMLAVALIQAAAIVDSEVTR